MAEDSQTDTYTGDEIQDAPSQQTFLTQQRASAPGDDRPVEKSKILEDSVAVYFKGGTRLFYAKSSGYIWELAGPPEESIYEETPYEMSKVPILYANVKDQPPVKVRRESGRPPRVTATVFPHPNPKNDTEQLRMYYIDTDDILRELCRGSDANLKGREKGFYPGALDQKRWKVAPGSPLTCYCDLRLKLMKVFYSATLTGNQEDQQYVFVAWIALEPCEWKTRRIT